MKKSISLSLILFLFHISFLQTQNLPFNPDLKPFYHGVASGDPLEDRVIIWTRVTPDSLMLITGSYIVALDTALANVVQKGVFSTHSDKDYTVKIDVTGLQSNTTYYYAFTALGKRSFIGRTKTTPSVLTDDRQALSADKPESEQISTEHLKFAVASCANYEAGYFNAYSRIADRNDLNAVIHLGDYYYEYSKGSHRNSKLRDPHRNYIPTNELATKTDYRLRLSLYRLDEDLQRMHQQHPIIAIWDDHEFANNAYENGAKKSDNEVGWAIRKQAAKNAYLEWMPLRVPNDSSTFYKTISYGKLLDLFMLDTRLNGRQKQAQEFDEPEDTLNPRQMISIAQQKWLIENLKNSKAQWKVIGSSVVFSDINLGFAAFFPKWRANIRLFQNKLLDMWQGYPSQRNKILDAIQQYNVNNVVVLSGDSHTSWSFDLNKTPVINSYTATKPSYVPQPHPYDEKTCNGYDCHTGEGACGIEFSTTSITSKSFSNMLPNYIVHRWESKSNKPHPKVKGNPIYNPHLKYVKLDTHGYFVLDVRANSVQCDYFNVSTIVKKEHTEHWSRGLSSLNGTNRITQSKTSAPAAPKLVQDIPAPVGKVVDMYYFFD